jgi:hypothetical protein
MGNYLEIEAVPNCNKCNSNHNSIKVLNHCYYDSLEQYELYGKIKIQRSMSQNLSKAPSSYFCQGCQEAY